MRPDTEPRKSLWSSWAWALPAAILALALFAPTAKSEGQIGVGIALAAFIMGKAVLDHYWPALESALRARGVPGWCFEDGWRSNLLVSGALAVAFAVYLRWAGARFAWLDALPGLAQFAVFFAALFAITWLGQTARRHFGIK